MPELRRDPIVGRWVIVAAERSQRPTDFSPQQSTAQQRGTCPFCPGNEETTPVEVYAVRPETLPANGPGWIVRVVSNKFPALLIEGELQRRGEGIYDKMNGVGAHEVVIETPDHDAELSTLSIGQFSAVLRAYRERILDLTKDRRFRYIQVFKNYGASAGATMEHSHTQLIATPIVPRRLDEELKGFAQHYELKERCILCDIIHQEMDSQRRVISQSDHYIVLAPFAARFPYETWVMPKSHEAAYEQLADEQIYDLALTFRDALRRINHTLDRPPYNFVLHTTPVNDPKGPHQYHWHFEIMPNVTRVAGFEWGTGFYINPVPPEESAERLRTAFPQSTPEV